MYVKNLAFSFILLLPLLSSCGDDSKSGKRPIVMGDSSMIITEKDEKYRQNFTEDISQPSAKGTEKSIAQMMVQVDSVNASKKMEDEEFSNAPVMGMTLSFENCDVIFNGLKAHTLGNRPIDPKVNSVSLLLDEGHFEEMKVRINGLENIEVEQRVITKLAVVHGQERMILHSLGRYTSPWYSLAGKNNIFISTGSNGIQYSEVNNGKIKAALTKALTDKRKKSTEAAAWLEVLRHTNSAQDAPCKIMVASSQWRVKGISNGKRIQKLIQFDIPL